MIERPFELLHEPDDRHENDGQQRDPARARQPPLPRTHAERRNRPGRVAREDHQDHRHHVPQVDGDRRLVEPADWPPPASVGQQALADRLSRDQQADECCREREHRDRRRIRVLHGLAGHADHVDRERPPPDQRGQGDHPAYGESVRQPAASSQGAVLPGEAALVDRTPAEQVVGEADHRHPPADHGDIDEHDTDGHHGGHGEAEPPVQGKQPRSQQDQQQVHGQEPQLQPDEPGGPREFGPVDTAKRRADHREYGHDYVEGRRP